VVVGGVCDHLNVTWCPQGCDSTTRQHKFDNYTCTCHDDLGFEDVGRNGRNCEPKNGRSPHRVSHSAVESSRSVCQPAGSQVSKWWLFSDVSSRTGLDLEAQKTGFGLGLGLDGYGLGLGPGVIR